MMQSATTIDFNRIRTDHDLRSLIISYLGQARNGKWLCPFHKEKTPSFTVKGDRFKCFGCGVSGDVTDFVALIDKTTVGEAAKKLGGYILDLGLTPAEIEAKRAEIRAEYDRRRVEQLAEEESKRAKAISRVAGMKDKVAHYHSQVGLMRDYWLSQGLTDSTIKYFKLGYCPDFPIWEKVEGEYRISQFVPSCTIPYFYQDRLTNIRHRLLGRDGDKYRPEFAGLPAQIFNLDILSDSFGGYLEPGQVIILEGEIKAMYFSQLPIPAVGIPGAETWKGHQEEWLPLFQNLETVYVILDPDAERQAREITATLNGNGIQAKQVTMPVKPDDYFVKCGGTIQGFMRILEQGRRIA